MVTFAIVLLVSAVFRLLYILPGYNPTKPRARRRGQPTRLLIVLGSGGHTSEMLSILRNLDPYLYTHRSYVVSSGDDFSSSKAIEFETALQARCKGSQQNMALAPSTYDINVIPRARKIHQPILTTPFSSLRCLFSCFAVLRAPCAQQPSRYETSQDDRAQEISECPMYTYPDLIIANGPATAVLVILACLLLRFFNVKDTQHRLRTIYVESWARVNSLSLSGRILMHGGMVNRMIVQWDNLARTNQGEFRGALVH
ncbi:MAG: hypothetical protein LQ352_003794 [Teloschistes flavicans]|nr:MAG: hypothetical protein LQ352_003794 [Teloschistes flavicans]